MLVPLGGVSGHQVFAQPGIAASASITQNLVAQAADGPDFGHYIGQFAQSVVEFHLASPLVPFLDERYQFITAQERIVDVRVILVGMMYVDHFHACLHVVIGWYGFRTVVVVAVGELALQVERFHGSDDEGEFEVHGSVCFKCTRTAIYGHAGCGTFFLETETTLAAVVPASRIGGTVGTQQRATIGRTPQFAVDSGLGISHPETVERPQPVGLPVHGDGHAVVVDRHFGGVPFAFVGSGSILSRQSGTEEIGGHFGFHGKFKAYVLHLQVALGSQCIGVFHPSVELHASGTGQFQGCISGLPGPGVVAGRLFGGHRFCLVVPDALFGFHDEGDGIAQ